MAGRTDKPRFIKRSIKPLVTRAWGPEYGRPDVAYEFSSGRRMVSTDRGKSGVYRRS